MAEGRRREVYDPDNMLLIAFEVADAGGFIHRKEKHRRPGVGYYLIKTQCIYGSVILSKKWHDINKFVMMITKYIINGYSFHTVPISVIS